MKYCEVGSYDHQVGYTFSSISCRWPVLTHPPQLQLRSSFLAAFLAFLAWIVLQCLYILLETCLDSCKQTCSEKCYIASFFAFFSIFLIQVQYWFWQHKWTKKRYARRDCLMDSSEQACAARFLQLFCFFLIILHHPISPNPSKGSTPCNKLCQQHENIIPLCCDDSIFYTSTIVFVLSSFLADHFCLRCKQLAMLLDEDLALSIRKYHYTWLCALRSLRLTSGLSALEALGDLPSKQFGSGNSTRKLSKLNLHLWIWSLFLNSSCQRLSRQATAIQHSCSCNCGWTLTAVKSITAVNGWLENTTILYNIKHY